MAIKEGKIDARLTDKYVELGVVNLELLKSTFDGIAPKTSLSTKVVNSGSGGGDRDKWDFSQWKREDKVGLELMKENDPKQYKALVGGKNRGE